MDTYAEVAVPAKGDKIFEAKNSVVNETSMKYNPGPLITRSYQVL